MTGRPCRPYTLDRLRQEIDWPQIALTERQWNYRDQSGAFGVFHVQPTRPEWPELRIVCDQGLEYLEQVEIEHWDAYDFSEFGSGLRGAVGFTAAFVDRRICLVEELDADGKTRVSYLHYIGEPLETPSYASTVALRLIEFDREPRHLPVEP